MAGMWLFIGSGLGVGTRVVGFGVTIELGERVLVEEAVVGVVVDTGVMVAGAEDTATVTVATLPTQGLS